MARSDRDRFDLEAELRNARPTAARRFIESLAATAAARRTGLRGARPAVAIVSGVVALVVASGIAYAASTAIESASLSVKKVAPSAARTAAVPRNAAQAQYDTGKVVDTPGPPKVGVDIPDDKKNEDGELITVQPKGRTDVVLRASFTVSETGVLNITVAGDDGENVLMNGARSSVDGEDFGNSQSKSYRRRIKTPRTVAIVISIPGSQLAGGEQLALRLAYTDLERRKVVTFVDAVAPAEIRRSNDRQVFRLSAANIAAINRQLRADGDATVTLRVNAPDAESVTINWQGSKTAASTATRVARRGRSIDTTAVANSVAGEITGGGFTVKD